MQQDQKLKLRVRYNGGEADDGTLPLYDGAKSIEGIAQSCCIITHALLNDEIVSRATALKGAKLSIKPPSRGSFLYEIVLLIEQYPATVAVSAPVVYDFFKLAYRRAVGFLEAEPESAALRRDFERKEPFFDDLAETLEGSLQRAHRPIEEDKVSKISIERPRSSLVTFDANTKDWVETRDADANPESFNGNVTRYNSITRNGRVFIEEENRVIPFKPDFDFPISKIWLLTWSLHGNNISGEKSLDLTVRTVRSARGQIKRILLVDCSRSS